MLLMAMIPLFFQGDRKKGVKSRVDNLLAASKNPERSAGGTDVLDIAKKFHCQIWSLNKTIAWLAKFKSKYGGLSSGPKSGQKAKEKLLCNPFLKIDNSVKYVRPAYSEFKNWPRISYEGWVGSSPFSEQGRKVKRKNIANRLARLSDKREEANLKRKDCVKKKEGGFCEICNKSFSELERHLKGELHTKFVKDSRNWVDVDSKLDVQLPSAINLLY